MNAKRLSEKDPDETVTLSWDFESQIGEEIIIGEPQVFIEVDNSLRRNTDADPDSMLEGAPQVDGTNVLQSVSGGIAGVDYKVTARIQDSSTPNQTLEKSSVLPVRWQ
jgi:hypothetical protein